MRILILRAITALALGSGSGDRRASQSLLPDHPSGGFIVKVRVQPRHGPLPGGQISDRRSVRAASGARLELRRPVDRILGLCAGTLEDYGDLLMRRAGPTRGGVRAMAIGVCAALALAGALAASTADARTTRFHAYVGGAATGAGHSFFVGDGVRLVFVDTFRSDTEYRVCWTRGAGRRCWTRTSGRRGHASTIFTAAPSSLGTYRTAWYVAGQPVASWSFYNGVGD